MRFSLAGTPLFLLFVFIGLSSNPVLAAAITNLDNQEARLEMMTDDGFQPVVIAAGETWHMTGRVYIHYHDHELWINEDEEFAIWNKDDFGPQRHLKPVGSTRN